MLQFPHSFFPIKSSKSFINLHKTEIFFVSTCYECLKIFSDYNWKQTSVKLHKTASLSPLSVVFSFSPHENARMLKNFILNCFSVTKIQIFNLKSARAESKFSEKIFFIPKRDLASSSFEASDWCQCLVNIETVLNVKLCHAILWVASQNTFVFNPLRETSHVPTARLCLEIK